MKLFVDDLRPAPEGWTLANTIIGAITAIKQFDPEVISLDHDICHHMVTIFLNNGTKQDQRQPDMVACAENFTAVAEYIALRYESRIALHSVGVHASCTCSDCPERTGGICKDDIVPKIFIHTMNPTGAKRLVDILSAFEVERDFTYTPLEDREK